ncbi:MAG: MoaD/ThiS family protein [bacterium]
MKITVSHVHPLKIDVEDEEEIEVEDGVTVDELLNEFDIPREQRHFVRPEINGEEKQISAKLSEGDHLHLFMHVNR